MVWGLSPELRDTCHPAEMGCSLPMPWEGEKSCRNGAGLLPAWLGSAGS